MTLRLVRRSPLVLMAAVGLALLGLVAIFGPLATAPIGAQPPSGAGSNIKFYLVGTKVNRTNITGIGVTNTREKAPEQVFKGNPEAITFKVQRPKYTLDGSLKVVFPPVLEVGQIFNASFLAVGAWDLQDADGRLQIQRRGYYMPPNQQDENLENAPPGPHTLKMDKPSQEKFYPPDVTFWTKDGVTFFSVDAGALFNTQGHGDSVEVVITYTYANDLKLAANSGGGSIDTGTGTSTGPSSSGNCPATFDGTWHDQGPSGGGRKDPGRELGTWGKWIFQQTGNNATGTIDNVGGTFGKGTFTGTVNGKTFSGTWTAGNANGKLTATRSADDCTFTTTWTIDNPSGQTGGTTTVGRPPNTTGSTTGGTGTGGGTAGGTGAGGSGNPWDTADGKNCFEKWIALATRLINAADLGATYNPLKPYSFNQYGILVDQETRSVYAPDDWAQHNGNKYWWMWDFYNTDTTAGQWVGSGTATVLKLATVPTLRDYVRSCAPGSTPGSTQQPPLGDGMILYAPNPVVPKGSQVPVRVDLINAKDVLNLDFTLSYQTDVVSPVGTPDKGSVISDIWETNLKQPGLYKFNFAQLTPFNGTGSVAGFRFNADAVGRTPLTMSVWTVNDSKGTKLPITVINGSITVYDPTDPNNPYNPKNPSPPGPPMEPTCSGSGRQTANDAQCCLKMWVELIPQNLIMDVDQSGTVDLRDAVIVLQNVAARSLN